MCVSKGAPKKPSYGPCNEIHWLNGTYNTFITSTTVNTTFSVWDLKAGVKELLGLTGLCEADVEEAPEPEGKRLLLDIIK